MKVRFSRLVFIDSCGAVFCCRRICLTSCELRWCAKHQQNITQHSAHAAKRRHAGPFLLSRLTLRGRICSPALLLPQNSIIGFGSLALEEPTSDTVRQYLTNVLSGASSLLALVQNVLEFSSLDPAGALGAESLLRRPQRRSVAREPFKAGALLEAVLEAVGPAAAANGVELVVSVSPQLYLGPDIEGDEAQICQARAPPLRACLLCCRVGCRRLACWQTPLQCSSAR